MKKDDLLLRIGDIDSKYVIAAENAATTSKASTPSNVSAAPHSVPVPDAVPRRKPARKWIWGLAATIALFTVIGSVLVAQDFGRPIPMAAIPSHNLEQADAPADTSSNPQEQHNAPQDHSNAPTEAGIQREQMPPLPDIDIAGRSRLLTSQEIEILFGDAFSYFENNVDNIVYEIVGIFARDDEVLAGQSRELRQIAALVQGVIAGGDTSILNVTIADSNYGYSATDNWWTPTLPFMFFDNRWTPAADDTLLDNFQVNLGSDIYPPLSEPPGYSGGRQRAYLITYDVAGLSFRIEGIGYMSDEDNWILSATEHAARTLLRRGAPDLSGITY